MANVTLGHGPIIVSLAQWVENNLSTIYKATNASEFNAAFDAFIDEHAHIAVNGKRLSRAQYRELLRQERADEQSATVSFLGAVEVPTHKKAPELTGTVGIYYKATIYDNEIFGARRGSTTVNSTLNVIVKDGDNLEERRVTNVDQVITTSRSD